VYASDFERSVLLVSIDDNVSTIVSVWVAPLEISDQQIKTTFSA